MSSPDIVAVAHWLQARHQLALFAVDHPGRAECGGAHKECDGQRGKHPRGQWSRQATFHPAVIRAMLANGPWNLGVACKMSRLLGVDEDRPGAFSDFAASVGEVIPPTFAVSTAKGRHYYFRQGDDAPLGNSRGRLAGHGIDIRGGGTGNGGFLVGPGSVHAAGTVYTPVNSSASILPVPGWLVEVLRPREPQPQRTGRPVSTFSSLKGLVKVVLEATPDVDRNTRLFWSSCRAGELISAGQVDQTTVTAVLVDAAARVGLTEVEALRTIASGMRTAAGVRCG